MNAKCATLNAQGSKQHAKHILHFALSVMRYAFCFEQWIAKDKTITTAALALLKLFSIAGRHSAVIVKTIEEGKCKSSNWVVEAAAK